ncbi:MAG: histidine phosphatase family protein [Helicobacteraceae bacterium]|nr:histidine phosphatase family protein [Helicobacteraceae bacterium]
MRITLVRHAEIEERYQRCYNGTIDIDLSEKGITQAKELASYLDTQSYDAVFCSDLLRAKKTLEHSLHAQDAIYTSQLREKSWGKHEGMSFDAIIAQGELEYIDFMQWIEALDGEEYASYIQRVREFFFDTLPSLNKQNVLVVTHAGVIRVLIALVQELSLEDAFSICIDYSSCVFYNVSSQSFAFK